jgi:hypothetical protein
MTNSRRAPTVCLLQPLLFDNLGHRHVAADFSAGHVSSDGGLLWLRQLDASLGLTRKLSRCFHDRRAPDLIEHTVEHLAAQRVLPLAAGYEDLNDHNHLRHDPLLAVAAGKTDPLGHDRRDPAQRGQPLASAPTLNRLELTNNLADDRYHKIDADHDAIADLLLELGVQTLPKDTREVVLDFDATGSLVYGMQEGRFWHGHYGDYCYLPLYAFIGDVPVWAQLRPADRDASDGTVAALKKIIPAIRRRCPQARIIVRADSGFCREEILAWCEDQPAHLGPVYYCMGLQRNARLEALLADAQFDARARACLTGGTARVFTEFEYRTRESWSRARRVIGKAEITRGDDNPRFVVTNLPRDGFAGEADAQRFGPAACYEQLYCGRGDMENRIKEQQLDLFGARTSTHYLAANQLRLWFSAFALLLLERFRTLALRGTEYAQATAGTIRCRLLKVGALVTVSVRRVQVRLSSAFPLREVLEHAHRALRALPAAAG